MNKNVIKWICLGILFISVAVFAQQNLPQIPAPSEAKPNFGSVVGKPDGALPKVPAGFSVELYADNIPGARIMEFAPNGDLLDFKSDSERGNPRLEDSLVVIFPDKAVAAKLEQLKELTAAQRRLRNRMWTEIKAGR